MAISTVTAKKEPIYARVGNELSFKISVVDEAGVAIDITAYTPTFKVIDTAGIPFISLALNSGISLEGTNTWVFYRSAILMNYKKNTFRYSFSIADGIEWLFGDFFIGDYESTATTSQINVVELASTVHIQIALVGGAGGAAAPIDGETVAAKYESVAGVNRFDDATKVKVDELYTKTALDLIIEDLNAKIAELETKVQQTGVAPRYFSITNEEIPDGTTGGYLVGTMSVEGNPAPIMSIMAGADKAYFEIRDINKLWFIGTADHATKPTYSITVLCTNGISPDLQVGLVLDVLAPTSALAPRYLGITEQSVDEDVAIGTTVCTVLYEADPAPTLSLTGTTKFTTSGNQIVTLDSLDHYSEPEHTFDLTLSNAHGSTTVSVTIYVNDVAGSITEGKTPNQTYNANSSFLSWGTLTDKVSFGFTADLLTTDTGTILEKSDANEGLGIWCEDGKLRARMGGSGTTNNTNTCFIEIDISTLTGLREYLFCFIPGADMRIVIYVDNLKLSYNKNGSYANAAASTGGGYGKTESTSAPGILTGVFSGVATNRLQTGKRYDNWVPQSA